MSVKYEAYSNYNRENTELEKITRTASGAETRARSIRVHSLPPGLLSAVQAMKMRGVAIVGSTESEDLGKLVIEEGSG